MTNPCQIIDALNQEFPHGTVLAPDQVGEHYRSDASGTGKNLPIAVIRPESTEQVATSLRICNQHCQSVVPQGGMTGLAGGANPGAGDIVLSLQRMSGIEEIDTAASTMTVLAGTPLEVAQNSARDAGFLLPIDFGARGSCQIGGVLATNAGGLRVIRHGMTRENVTGLECVLANGEILSSLTKMIKNNAGYDLRQLIIGSEGTLAVITRAVLRLEPAPLQGGTALCALDSFDNVVRLLRAARRLGGLSAFEAMWHAYFKLICDDEGQCFFDSAYPYYVLVETCGFGNEDVGRRFETFLGDAFERGMIADALIAQSGKESQAFWSVREGHALDQLLPGLINMDVSIEIGRLGQFAETCSTELNARFPGIFVSFFGHIGDSNLHIAVSLEDMEETDRHEIDRIAYQLVRRFGGSVSAEHGIGTLKRDFLDYSRSGAELDAMRQIKQALDPNGILNPGKVL